jgi:hypothetical protein
MSRPILAFGVGCVAAGLENRFLLTIWVVVEKRWKDEGKEFVELHNGNATRCIELFLGKDRFES